MGDDDGRQAQVIDQSPQQVQQPRLNRDIQPSGRLIHEDQAWSGDEVARDLQPLPHAAGEGPGAVVDTVMADLHPSQPVVGGFADAAIVALPHRHQPLPTFAPAETFMRSPSAGFWCTKAPVGAHQEPPFRL